MKIKFFLVVSLIILLSGFISSDDKIIGANGIASLIIDVSTAKDIKKAFPNGKREVKKKHMQGHSHVLLKTGECKEIIGKKHTVRYVKYVDEKNGLIFNFGKADNLKTISFIKPTKYKTNKGIGIGDSFDMLDSLYGKPVWIRHISGNHKMHGNLLFYPNDSLATNANLTVDELNTLQSHKLIIEKIVLVKASTN